MLVENRPWFSAEVIVPLEDDDLPLPNLSLMARYAAMTDAELIAELWLLTQERRVQ